MLTRLLQVQGRQICSPCLQWHRLSKKPAASIMHRCIDQHDLPSNEVIHDVHEALTGRSARRCGKRCQQHQWCQMLSMTWGALCTCCSTGASSVLGHELISWEDHLQTAHWERLTEEPRRVDILQACFASYVACMHLGRAYHGHCLH